MTPVPPQQSAERLFPDTPLIWHCEITGNPVGTDTRVIGAPPCACQGCRAASDLTRLNAKVEELERDRNEWEAKAISLFWACPDATKVGDVQKLKAKADSLLAAEAQVADLSARLARAVEVMRWYAARVAGCRKFTDEGHMARNALDADGGERARAFLSEQENPHG